MNRAALILSIAALLSLGVVTPVLAAVPGNDVYSGRTAIVALPFVDAVDTTEATTDADDAEASAQCGAPPTDASVWYEHTAAADGGLIVETFESDYPVGVIVVTGGPGSFSVLACGGGGVSFETVGGETYAILLFDFVDDGTNGGSLAVSVHEIPPAPVLEITIAAAGSFNPVTGSATIRGTLTCTGGDEFGKNFLDIQLVQNVGRFRFAGQGFATFDCNGASQVWEVETFSDDGKFGGGKAFVHLFALACGEGGCDEVDTTATVTLRR